MFTTTNTPTLSWPQIATVLAITTLLFSKIVSSSKADITNYPHHCSSIVPQSAPVNPEATTIPFPPDQDGYFLGGDQLVELSYSSRGYNSSTDRKILLFQTHGVYSTDSDDVFQVKASLIIQPSRQVHYFSDSRVLSTWSPKGALSFEIEGFWSKSTGRLCMIGSSSVNSGEGQVHELSAVLKVSGVGVSNDISSLVTGTLESLNSADDSSYFSSVSFMMFPLMNYKYTEVTKEADNGCTVDLDVARASLPLPLSVSICSVFSSAIEFEMEHSNACSSAESCSPFSENTGFSARMMSLSSIQCSESKRSLRLLIEFSNSSSHYSYYRPFNPKATLVAEGSWNSLKNQLCIIACRISSSDSSFDSSQVMDCSMRLCLMFPAALSIRNTSRAFVYLWTNKTSNVPGYFDKIKFHSYHSYQSDSIMIPGMKYEYSLIDRAKGLCPKKLSGRNKGYYPPSKPYTMRFDMSTRNSRGRKSKWGYATPVAIGDEIAPRNFYSWSSRDLEQLKNATEIPLTNISYQMSFSTYNASSKGYDEVEIFAEGVYDGETGTLCMVGCRYVNSSDRTSGNDKMDCDILVNVQFPLMNSKDYIEGRIESTREKSSTLYLDSVFFTAVPYYSHGDTIWRLDMEIIMVLISYTFVCLSIRYQILYVKKRRAMFPLISILMLVVLALGWMIPLVLNFEALFLPKQNTRSVLLRSGGWLEANEVIVRVVTMIAFLLQIRLLQLVWSARFSDENLKASWSPQIKTLFVCLPLYILGGLIAFFVNYRTKKLGDQMNSSGFRSYHKSLWVGFRSYAGLVLDGFLLPQILFNIFKDSKEKALSCVFYIGVTLVRLIPHGYDLYRAHYYVDSFDWSYTYADHAADYYSTAWNMIIILVGLLFAAIIYLQQRNGGRSILPRRFKELQGYQKVPIFGDL